MPAPTAEQTATGQSSLLVGVDVGGTFTDLVAFDPTTEKLSVLKLPSTPPDFHRAVIDAATRVCAGDRPAQLVHGSTVATNALLQRAGEPVAFVTTEGFRDLLLIGRQNRPNLYALTVRRPPPITPEENWFTVRERIAADGEARALVDERARVHLEPLEVPIKRRQRLQPVAAELVGDVVCGLIDPLRSDAAAFKFVGRQVVDRVARAGCGGGARRGDGAIGAIRIRNARAIAARSGDP